MGARGPKSTYTDSACPNRECRDYGQLNRGNVASNGTKATQDGRRRNFLCNTCGRSFCERVGTAFYDLRTPEDKVLLAMNSQSSTMKLLLRGMSLRGIADVLSVKLDTVRTWLARCAQQAEVVNEQLVREIEVSRVELDELWTFVRKKGLRQWQTRQREKGKPGFG